VFRIGSALSSVSMAPLVIVCSCRRGAPTVFKSVLPVLDATLDQPGTAIQIPTVHGAVSGWGAVCVCGLCYTRCGECFKLVLAAKCQHGPNVNACNSRNGATAVFKSVLHVLDATLDKPGTAMQTCPRPGPKRARCRLRVERCVCVFLCYFECAACIRLGLRCPVSAWHLW
jgi:hypothetical protein